MNFVEPNYYEHQKQSIEMANPSNTNYFAFLFDCGTGKTLACIKTIRNVYELHGLILPTLILAPSIVLQNWREEWLKFSKIDPNLVHILTGSTPQRIKTLLSCIKCGQGFIAITNYDILCNKDMQQALEDWCPEILVIDESQKIKSPSSKRTKQVLRLAGKAKYRYILTGTPILNSPMDIFTQWLALDGGKTFGKNFFSFRAQFFYDKNARMPRQSYFPNWQILPSSYDRIKGLIIPVSLRAKKEECLDLPPLIKQRVYVELSDEQRRVYTEMLNDFISFIDDTAVVADLVITKMMKLQQIISGFVLKEDKQVYHFAKNHRIEALKELLTDIIPAEEKVIIWCVFIENYKQVAKACEEIGAKYVEVHGAIPTNTKYSNVDSFNNDPSIRCFIGHPSSVGIGINLNAASHSIIYSRSHSLEQDVQSESRNYRSGSERHKTITKIDLVAKDTLDETILKVLEAKLTDAKKIVDIIKQHRKELKK